MGIKKVNIEHVSINDNQSFKLEHYAVPLDDIMPIHKHKEWEISWIIKGKGSRIVGNSLEPIETGEVIILPPDLPHCWIFSQDGEEQYVESMTIQFPQDLIDGQILQFGEFAGIGKFLKKFGGGAILRDQDSCKAKEYISRIHKQSDGFRLLAFLEMMLFLSRTAQYRELNIASFYNKDKTQNNKRMEKVLKYISTNYMKDISLDDISNIASMNKSAFCSFFKKNTRTSFVNYLSRYRIEIATRLLRESNKPVSDICYEVGFNDIPHFNRLFKKKQGMSPSQYRALE